MTQKTVQIDERAAVLAHAQNLKMARSAHAFIRGNTVQFYRWIDDLKKGALPEGPAVWICGDCHVGNLGPLASAEGGIAIAIRDVDQMVVGNPAHDLVRLGLSLASAARGGDLPGVTTARMLEHMMEGYAASMAGEASPNDEPPPTVHGTMKKALKRTWRHLAKERIEDTKSAIPLGKRFWPLGGDERREIKRLFETEHVRRLATMLRGRDDDAAVRLVDAAYWMKGCSSLGRLRYCVLLEVGEDNPELCLMDIKEATASAAPGDKKTAVPHDPGSRVVEGARHLTPSLGDRMRSARLLDRSVFVRELLPQDLKIDLETLAAEEAMHTAGFFATVLGKAHARQMDPDTRKAWARELKKAHPRDLEAPTWLWRSVVDLLALHERAYLEHCRRYALQR